MITVVPAILEKTFEDIQEKVRRIKPYLNFVQLDVMDNQFVPNETFRDPKKIAELDIEMEVHLMITKPFLFVPQWLLPNVKRVIVHYEAAESNMDLVIGLIKNAGKEVGVAINPETSTYEIKDYLDKIDMVVVMGVDPGFSGQQFHRDVLEKIKEVKKWKPEMIVEVDGGVNNQTRNMIVDAGADVLGAASALWNAPDLEVAIQELREGVKRQ